MIYANLSAAASSAVETILQKGRLSRAPMDYVSIGPGDVSFDSSFLSRLSRRAVVETYVSVDISSEILSSRVQRVCSELGENAMKVLAVLTDVSELVGVDTFLRDAPRRALYSLNLGTPGAIDEQTLIGELYSTMAPDDSLLVRCQLHPYGAEHLADLPEGDCDRLLAPFSSSAFATFAKGPIEDAFAPEFLNGQLMLRPRHGISQVNNAIDIEAFYVTNDSDSDGGYHVTTTRLYDHFSIARWFRRSGWRIRWSEHLSDAGTGLYLLKKKW